MAGFFIAAIEALRRFVNNLRMLVLIPPRCLAQKNLAVAQNRANFMICRDRQEGANQ
jgi:hypothetical protein